MGEKQLTFIISQTSVSFAEVSRSSGALIRSEELLFTHFSSHELKDQLKRWVEEHDLKSNQFDEYSLVWCSPVNTLVPMSLFDASSPEDLATAVFDGGISNEELDFNRLVEHAVVNVFQIPLWVKSFFVINFPRIIMQHERTVEIRAGLRANSFKPKAMISVYADYVGVLLIEQGVIRFSNCFTYASKEDILYYVQYAMSNNTLTADQVTIYSNFGTTTDEKMAQDMLADLLRLDPINYLQGEIQPCHLNQLLCV
jgi:hypothetical protein